MREPIDFSLLGTAVRPRALVLFFLVLCFLVLPVPASGQAPAPSATASLNEKGDLSALMVEGIDRFLTAETERVRQARGGLWQRDFSSPEAFRKSIAPQRDLLARRLGVVESEQHPSWKC
jgi:hypothetical protein